MATSESDRRQTRRFGMTLPVTLRNCGPRNADVSAVTRDVSSSGTYVYVEYFTLNPGAVVEFVLELASSITLTAPVFVWCIAHVIRVDAADAKVGVALQINNYRIMGSS